MATALCGTGVAVLRGTRIADEQPKCRQSRSPGVISVRNSLSPAVSDGFALLLSQLLSRLRPASARAVTSAVSLVSAGVRRPHAASSVAASRGLMVCVPVPTTLAGPRLLTGAQPAHHGDCTATTAAHPLRQRSDDGSAANAATTVAVSATAATRRFVSAVLAATPGSTSFLSATAAVAATSGQFRGC